MKRLLVTVRHWYQRNFGHVYLTQTKLGGQTECWRFRARFGRIALCWWATPFVCRLSPNGDIINIACEWMRGYGKPFLGWRWSYEPTSNDIKNGGAW